MFQQLTGNWIGTNCLYLEGADGPKLESPSHLTASIVVSGFLEVRYDWAYEAKQKQGLIVFGDDAKQATVAWIDSFHTAKRVMHFLGASEANAVSVKGTYSVGEGPEWGWSIRLELAGAELRLTMFNISPEGQEYLAVLAVYQRAE
jgi:hypothetical protein